MKRIFLKFFFLFYLSGIYAQEDSSTEIYTLDSIIITGQRLYPVSYSISSVDVYNVAQTLSPSGGIESVLQQAAGVEIRRRGIGDVQSDVYIRGGHFEQTGIEIDGVPMNDIQTGHHSMNLPLPYSALEQIEVIKGPAARIFGQNAMTGMLRFQTRRISRNSLRIQLDAGAFDSYGWGISGSKKGEKSGVFFALDQAQSGGYRYNTDYRILRNYLKFKTGKFQISGGYALRNFGANGFYASPDYKDQYEETQTAFIALQYKKHTGNLAYESTVYWRHNHDDYVFLRYNPGFYNNIHNTHNTGIKTGMSYVSKAGISALGLEWQNGIIQSNNLGDHKRYAIRLFMEHDWQYRKWHLQPGFILTREDEGEIMLLPGFNMGYRLTPHSQLYFNLGSTYRTPTFTEKYYTSPAEQGNTELIAEKARGIDLGIKTKRNHYSFQSTLFYRKTSGAIDWVKNTEEEKWQAENISSLQSLGWENSISFNADIHRFQIHYTYLSEKSDENTYTFSRYNLNAYKHQALLQWSCLYNHKWKPMLRYRYLQRPSGNGISLVEAELSYQLNNFNLGIRGANLLDTEYYEANLVPMPGRHLTLNLSFTY